MSDDTLLSNPALDAALRAQEAIRPTLSPGPQPVTSGPGHSPPSEALTASLAAREGQSGAMGDGYVGTPPESKPLVSGALAAVAGMLSAGGMMVAPALPMPWSIIVGAVALFVGWLAGQPLKVPEWMASKPILPLTIAPAVGTMGVSLAAYAAVLPEGWIQRGLLLVSVAAMILGGKTAPNVAPKA